MKGHIDVKRDPLPARKLARPREYFQSYRSVVNKRPKILSQRHHRRQGFAAQYELARAKPEHEHRTGSACRGNEPAVVEVLQVAPRARHDSASVSLPLDRGVIGRWTGPLVRSALMRADHCRVQFVRDASDHVGILDRRRNAMAVVDKEREAGNYQHPARNQRDLRDEPRRGVLVCDQEAQADVDERTMKRPMVICVTRSCMKR
jgi:hypothetical protein